jgi:glycosyltransferase involved in cell wall biosynthesis
MPSHSSKVTALQRLFLKAAATFARGIITDSENSRQDLVRLYRLPESRIAVVYCGYTSSVYNDAPVNSQLLKDVRARFGLERPYILHHGTVQPRKNLARLIQAYRALIGSQPSLDLDLVLAGGLGWHFEEIIAAARASGPGRVVLTGALPDEELATLVKGAELVVIPSLYEGFCLPMIESMACAVPTIAATTSCLQEVSGGALRYFDPYSIEEMKQRMQEVIENTELRKQLAVAGKAQAAKYSWERCGREALNAIKSFQ